MARVWAARLHGTRGFRKLVAVKTILPGVMDGERLEQMFLEEATLASGIHHPNVVDTLELGEQDGVLFMALEWVDGEPLSLVMQEANKRGGIPLPIGVNLVVQACKGLHAAHELADDAGTPLGVVHRDISPHNVLVSYGGIAKVVDFGIAKATQRSSSLTDAGEIKGKLAYMAPEQIRGRAVDRRTDVFALGTLLYAVTTGRHPWKGEHPGATTERLCSDRPVTPPSAVCEDYPEALEAAVLTALEKDPAKRFPTAQHLLTALEDAVPSSLEGNAEARIGEFMQKLVGPRGVERRKQIRLAGELLDQRRALSGTLTSTTGTSGSTSAVAVSVPVDVGAPLSRPSMVNRTGHSDATPLTRVERRGLDKLVWFAVAVAFAGCLGFATRRAMNGGEPTTARAAAGSELPRAPMPPTPPPQPATTTSVPVSVAPAEPPSERDAGARGKGKLGSRNAVHAFAPRVVGTAPSAVAPTANVMPETPNAAPAASAAPKPSANAWDPSTFGNRY
jgi:serine/threonine-protein kinase